MATKMKLAGTTANTFQIGLTGVTLSSANASSAYTLLLPANAGSANQVLSTNGSGNLNWVTPVSIGGSNTQLQFNDNGSLGGSAALTFNKSSNLVTASGNVSASYFIGNGALLTSLAGANVTGTVSAATTAGTVTTAAQPNITSVGTLSSLAVTANVTAGNFVGTFANGNSNITIPAASGNINLSAGGTPNELVITSTGVNIAGTLNATGNANAGNIGATNGVFTNVSGNGAALTSITGANVTGTVSSATTAGTVTANAQPNITSVGTLTSATITTATITTGNITTINSGLMQSGNSNVTITANGNVTISAVGGARITATSAGANITGTLGVSGNANAGNIGATNGIFTTVAGTLSTAAQPNITSVGSLSSLTVTGNANAGNIGATNGIFTTVAGTLSTAAQPNITSIGTLSSLTVTGNVVAGNANLGNLAAANFFSGNGSLLTGVTVATANYSNFAGTVTTAAQPNITSIGTLTTLTVSGNATLSANLTVGQSANIGGGSGGNLTGANNVNANYFTALFSANLGNSVTANYFVGNGSLLTGIAAASATQLVNGNSNIIVNANSFITMATTGSEKLRIQTDGNVGIGVTNPQARLHVAKGTGPYTFRCDDSTAGSGISVVANFTNTVDSDLVAWISQVGATTKYSMLESSIANINLILNGTNGGNVGIGVTTPESKLHVYKAISSPTPQVKTLFSIWDLYDNGNYGQYFRILGGTTGFNLLSNYGDLVLGSRGDGSATYTANVILTTTGLVGIGTSSPAQKLTVLGGIQVTGSATIGATMSPGILSYESPVTRMYVGDGTGYSYALSKRSSSTTTDILTINETGTALVVKANSNDVGLEVQGTNPYIFLNPGTGGRDWALQAVNAATGFRIYDSTRGAQTLAVSNDGTVSIDAPANSAPGLTVATTVSVGSTYSRGNLSIGRATSGTTQSHILHFGYSPLDYYGFRINNTNDPAAEAAGNLDIQRGGVSSWINILNINNVGAITVTAAGSGNTLTVNGTTVASNVQITSLGVGTAASGTTGEIRATNNITAYYSSDSRLKENITPIAHPVEKVMQLSGVEFDWTDTYIKDHGGEDGYFVRKHDVGVIAQEVQKVLPEIVAERPDGMLAVRYEKMVALLIEAIKEQNTKIEKLEQTVAKLIGDK